MPAIVLSLSLGTSVAPRPSEAGPAELSESPDAALIRYPDVSEDRIAFRYDGDIWIVGKKGGSATRLSTPRGNESFPRFSPDGSRLAMVAGYEGGSDVYVVDLETRGLPQRVTYHPATEILCDWTPDGKELLFMADRAEGPPRGSMALYRAPAAGGPAVKLPLPYAAFGTIDASGEWLAYTPRSREFRTWKRYRGGKAQDVWLFNLKTYEARKITEHPGTDALPMWHEGRVVFLSDRGSNHRLNLWMYDPVSESTSQLTDFADWDVKWPSVGPHDVVFENGGRLYRYEFQSRRTVEVRVELAGDFEKLRPQRRGVEDLVGAASLGPGAKRVALAARGDLFTIPVEEGFTRKLTTSSDSAERSPAWSPDGKWIAYFSDSRGEYDLWIRRSDGREFVRGDETTRRSEVRLAQLGTGWKSNLIWSPDSTQLTYESSDGGLYLVNFETGERLTLASSKMGAPTPSWSPDSRWIAWASLAPGTLTSVLFLHDLRSRETRQVTSELFSADAPSFGADGDWLYFTSSRTFDPVYSDFDNSWVYSNSTNLVAVPLRADVENPWAVSNDEEHPGADPASAPDTDADTDTDASSEVAGDGDVADAGAEADDAEADDAEADDIALELEGFEARAILLPVAAGALGNVVGLDGKVAYLRRARAGSGGGGGRLVTYTPGEDDEVLVCEGVSSFSVGAGGETALVIQGGEHATVALAAGSKPELLDTSGLEVVIRPREEWTQILHDAHRLMRDFFYDSGMHGVDWEAVRDRYVGALRSATSRDDVQYLIGEMIGELNVGHAYNYSPPAGLEKAPSGPAAGLLGADLAVEDGAWRITRIHGGADYDYDARGPLTQLGVEVQVGDWLLAVNGRPISITADIGLAFLGTAGKPTELLVNTVPELDGNERRVVVEPVSSERALRYRGWVAANRERVRELSGGRVGYVHVPDTGRNGQAELVRQYSGQYHQEALIIDERWNGGGQIPDRFVELLNRPATNFWATRSAELTWPLGAHLGPKAMLINESAGSGGDAFPYYFRQAGLGKLIGTRTWGGLVGIRGGPTFVDGGRISVPSFAFFDLDNTWGVEGHGVEPDIEVVDDPTLLARGADPQLEAAVRHLLEELKSFKPLAPERPGAPNRVGSGLPPEDF